MSFSLFFFLDRLFSPQPEAKIVKKSPQLRAKLDKTTRKHLATSVARAKKKFRALAASVAGAKKKFWALRQVSLGQKKYFGTCDKCRTSQKKIPRTCDKCRTVFQKKVGGATRSPAEDKIWSGALNVNAASCATSRELLQGQDSVRGAGGAPTLSKCVSRPEFAPFKAFDSPPLRRLKSAHG